jgi:hypothetical protein
VVGVLLELRALAAVEDVLEQQRVDAELLSGDGDGLDIMQTLDAYPGHPRIGRDPGQLISARRLVVVEASLIVVEHINRDLLDELRAGMDECGRAQAGW